MVCVWEYRVVLPFTLEEYKIAQLYMVAKYSASESNGSDGDGVELLKNEPFEEDDRRGQYTHKLYHLASKLPSWLVGLFPKKALMLEEEAWNAYPYCMTVLKCPFFSNFRLVLETRHVADRGTTANALDLDAKTLKKRIVDFIDIAMDPVDNYVEEEDPSKFRSSKTARGPLQEGWQQSCEPVMCAYKLVTVDVPYWGFGSRLEKFIGKTAQRKIFLEGHRKCFCWLDEWFGLTMEDVRRMEYETAEAIRRARAMAIGRPDEDAAAVPASGAAAEYDDASARAAAAEEASDTATALRHDGSGGGAGPLKELSFNSRKDYSRSNSRELTSPRLLRPSSLVGPSVAVGITTLSASDLDSDSFVTSSTVPIPSMRSPRASGVFRSARNSFTEERKRSPSKSAFHHAESYEFLPSLESSGERNGSSSWHISPSTSSASGIDTTEADVMSQCVDVLDRVIAWTKVRAAQGPAAAAVSRVSPAAAPPAPSAAAVSVSVASPAAADKDSGSSNGKKQPSSLAEDAKSSSTAFNLDYYVSVLDRAVSLLTKRRQQ